MEIVAKTGRDAYVAAVEHALDGRKRAPRGRKTRDGGFTAILLETPFDALPIDTGRGVVSAIAAAEALQLVGGFSYPELLFAIAPKFRDFVEHDGKFHGAYGRRVGTQVVDAVTKLRKDADTRQAVVTLWDPMLDNAVGRKDYPCTVALQFQVEDGKLCMNTFMRSNDVWLGLPYDLFQFTQLQMSVARSLGLAYGWYRHTTLSLHAYEDDVDNLMNVHAPSPVTGQFQPQGIGLDDLPFVHVMKRARDLMSGSDIARETMSERWFANMLQPHIARIARKAERRETNVG